MHFGFLFALRASQPDPRLPSKPPCVLHEECQWAQQTKFFIGSAKFI